MSDFPWKSPPMSHQLDVLRRAWKSNEFALFWEMGTGKTFATVNMAAARYMKGQIDAVVVFCPTPIKMVWKQEFEKWCPCEYSIRVVEAGATSKDSLIRYTCSDTGNLKVVVVGIEALSQGGKLNKQHRLIYTPGRMPLALKGFIQENRTFAICDESSKLKNHKSIRTKMAVDLASDAHFRWILTGTPITQGIEDLYPQFRFLNPNIIGLKSYFLFKNLYCVTGGFQGKQILDYQNVPQLMNKVRPYTDVRKKSEVLDLPPKVYEKMVVEPTKEQLGLIKQLKDVFEAEHEGDLLTTKTILERLTRFQQIIGGHFPFNDRDLETKKKFSVKPISGKNPKLEALSSVLEDLPHDTKVIIWARFVPEIELIRDSISEMFPGQVVTFYGRDTEEERETNVTAFQTGNARFIVSSQQVGGMGQTWTAATVVIYYSNSFSYEDRRQSEDRAHRKGQENKVTYVDIEAAHRYDRMILQAIERKGDLASMVDEELTS